MQGEGPKLGTEIMVTLACMSQRSCVICSLIDFIRIGYVSHSPDMPC